MVVGCFIVALILRLEELGEIGGFWEDFWSWIRGYFNPELDSDTAETEELQSELVEQDNPLQKPRENYGTLFVGVGKYFFRILAVVLVLKSCNLNSAKLSLNNTEKSENVSLNNSDNLGYLDEYGQVDL